MTKSLMKTLARSALATALAAGFAITGTSIFSSGPDVDGNEGVTRSRSDVMDNLRASNIPDEEHRAWSRHPHRRLQDGGDLL